MYQYEARRVMEPKAPTGRPLQGQGFVLRAHLLQPALGPVNQTLLRTSYGAVGSGFGISDPSHKETESASVRVVHTAPVFCPSTYTHLFHGRAAAMEIEEAGSRLSCGGQAHP